MPLVLAELIDILAMHVILHGLWKLVWGSRAVEADTQFRLFFIITCTP